jgi:hypothetical protein
LFNELESNVLLFLKEKKRKKKAILHEVMMNENGRKND